MKEELPESIAQREIRCIQSTLQQVDTKKKRRFVYEEKDNEMSQNMKFSLVLQQALSRKFKHRFPNLNESTV